ncbi:PspC domain-containing protein [Oceanobacillus halophilus]|uniref:PspC domain-containing protein n=1 Tax=Oceanobacillus halophilus TaxID=930130 RepID=A0A495A739_9BACI|nr:PspC domain-containing protein [Oceanobacillus halophilus]RKQ35559.1 PspC domain-containing protein [Oceanobacillus halophilus]
MKRLYRSTSNRMVAGVLGGLGEYFNIDATLLRLIFLVLLFASFFTFGFAYLLAIFIIPNDDSIY